MRVFHHLQEEKGFVAKKNEKQLQDQELFFSEGWKFRARKEIWRYPRKMVLSS
jgi:hypothetical protein